MKSEPRTYTERPGRTAPKRPGYVSTTNACKLCKPLGAALAFRGVEGAVPFLHGSQGCATYMRRYLISHYREPVDIASSSLGEKHAVYGGGPNLKQGLKNVIRKYKPQLIGIATTCLTETIGDDVRMILNEFRRESQDMDLPALVSVSTPSYAGTHMEGFHAAVKALVEQLASPAEPHDGVNLFPGFVSPADIRYVKEILHDFDLPGVVLPDISETLDGPAQAEYSELPAGGTPLAGIRAMGSARASIEWSRTLADRLSPGRHLEEKFGVPLHRLGIPLGISESDRFFEILGNLSNRPMPSKHALERGRLVDAYVDGHKYVFGKRAVVYGEEDLVVALTAFLVEIGVRPVLCASGGKSGLLGRVIGELTGSFLDKPPEVREGADFYDIAEEVQDLHPDLLVGHSKGFRLSQKLNVPLIRVGFPIHDRFGGQRLLHVGYRGTQALLDRIVNAVLEKKQADSSVGYGYM